MACVAKDLDYPDFEDSRDYSRYPDGKTLLAFLDRYGTRIDKDDAQPGDVMVFHINRPRSKKRKPRHAAFITDKGMLHTDGLVGRVVEQRLDKGWLERAICAYRLNGVAN